MVGQYKHVKVLYLWKDMYYGEEYGVPVERRTYNLWRNTTSGRGQVISLATVQKEEGIIQGTSGRDSTRGGKQSTNERAVLGEQLVCWPGNQVQVCIKAKGQCSSASWGRWQEETHRLQEERGACSRKRWRGGGGQWQQREGDGRSSRGNIDCRRKGGSGSGKSWGGEEDRNSKEEAAGTRNSRKIVVERGAVILEVGK